ncbi:MAG TPA: type II toxin-antitoxin system RelE/ParE family toxin [Roseiarcus sp.]
MRIFKTKDFSRLARQQRIGDGQLVEAVKRADRGLIDADVGGGLIKQRVPRPGQGRRGGYRVLLAFQFEARAVFLYAFAKSERENIEPDALRYWREVAATYLKLDETVLVRLITEDKLFEVNYYAEDQLP